MYSDLTIIIPTLNEEKNIGVLISKILDTYPKINILVCDDGSTDKTQEIVKGFGKNVSLLDRGGEKVHGLTASIIEGILRSNTKYSIIMDGDVQHPPKSIKNLYKPLKKEADFVIGAREKVVGRWDLNRKIISYVATTLAKMRLMFGGISIRDPMSGFFGVKTKVAKRIILDKRTKFELEGYKVLFDLLKYSKGAKVKETNYIFGMRGHGASKLGKKQIICLLKALLR